MISKQSSFTGEYLHRWKGVLLMSNFHFFSKIRKKQVIVGFLLVLCVFIIVAAFFIEEKNKNDQKLSEKKVLIAEWIPGLSPTDLDYLMSRDIYAVYGVIGEKRLDLPDIRNLSENELIPYMYPNGPVCGYGVSSMGFIEIDLFDGMPVNRTTTEEIYRIIESNGRVLNQKDIPVIFIRTALAEADEGNLT
jgi:hypothetical protein